MSDTIELVWSGPERIIPGVAKVTLGSKFHCPVKWAQSYIDQGLAKKAASRSVQKAKED